MHAVVRENTLVIHGQPNDDDYTFSLLDQTGVVYYDSDIIVALDSCL